MPYLNRKVFSLATALCLRKPLFARSICIRHHGASLVYRLFVHVPSVRLFGLHCPLQRLG